MREVFIISAHTLKFGKYLDKSIKDLTAMTVLGCLKEIGMDRKMVQAVWFSNSGWGRAKGQYSIRGQVALRPIGIDSIPITNVENACAGGSTAFHHAWLGVAGGCYDLTMAVGAEKIYHPNKFAIFSAFLGGLDIENIDEILRGLSDYAMTPEDQSAMQRHFLAYPESKNGVSKPKKNTLSKKLTEYKDMCKEYLKLGDLIGCETLRDIRKSLSGNHSPFMDVYGDMARRHMHQYGSTPEQLAAIASKNHFNSSLNPNAQYHFTITPEEVLRDRMVSWPITRSMCAPIGDGAASAVLCSEEMARRLGFRKQAVKVRASVLGSGSTRDPEGVDIAVRLGKKAYHMAGIGAENVNLAEVHDATAYGELHQTETLGFCREGEGGTFAVSGATALGGKIPINTSGGLESRGHPVGASGLAQIHEIVVQLKGQAGKRQVQGARIGLAENGGGFLGHEEAAMCIHILEKPQT